MIRLQRLALTLVIAGSTLTPAVAHVTVHPKIVAAGSTPVLRFRCPNERATSATIELAVQLPSGVRFTTLRLPAVAGWHGGVRVGARGEGDVVTWSGGRIAPHAAQTFAIVAGPMPATGHTLPFKAVQTYDNGEVVRWIEERAPGEAEPPLPAPVVEVR